jgi:hypothetical protein
MDLNLDDLHKKILFDSIELNKEIKSIIFISKKNTFYWNKNTKIEI